MRWLGVNRPIVATSGRGSRPGGGVGCLVLNAAVMARMVRAPSPPADWCAVELQWPGCMPVAVIVVYNPSRGGVGCDMTTDDMGSRLTAACDLHDELLRSRRYSSVLLLGDFNCSMMTRDRYYDPAAMPAPQHRPHHALVARMQHMQVSPLHGRGDSTPAATTSRPGDGEEATGTGAEVDFICARADDTRVRPMPHFPYDGALGFHAHRMMGAVVTLAPAGTVTETEPTRRQWRWRLPHFGDPRWQDAARFIQQRLTTPSARPAPTASVDEAWSALYTTLEQMLDHTMPSVQAGQGTRRRPLPKAVLQAIRQAREQRDRVFALRRRDDVGADALATAEQALKRLRGEARRAQRAFVAETRRQLVDQLVRLRFVDQHALTELLNRLVPANATVARGAGTIPHESGHPPPLRRFRDAFRERAAETRGLAPVFADESPEMVAMRAFIPVAANNAMLDGVITWQEVYRVIFPITHHMAPCVAPCFAACGVCRAFIDQLNAHGADHAVPAPTWSPHIHTSVASGPNGIAAEALRWLQCDDLDDRFELRKALSLRLADAINRCIATGHVPDTHQSLDAVVTPLLKPGTAEHPANPADPDCYRTITVGDTLMKVMGLVILSRLTHWSEANALLSPAQAGFRAGHGTEMHVATLLETVKYHLREHKVVYALFIDLRKAYDMVHLETLWRLLAHMGVPEPLVRLLRDWGRRRRSRVRVNGSMTESFPTDKGTPQGDVFSPLGFDLFIEPLLRMLVASAALQGVPVGKAGDTWRTIVKALGYADDVVTLATTPAELQVALDIIMRWCRAWHMELGVGQGKTEAMVFSYRRQREPEPLTVGDGRLVHWVRKYRYLGYVLCHNLDTTAAFNAMTERINATIARWFSPWAALRHLPLEVQLLLLTSHIYGTFNYLSGVIPYSTTQLATVQALVNRALNYILGVDTPFPRMIVNHETGIPSVFAQVVRNRLRMQWQADLAPDTCLWKRVIRAAGGAAVARMRSLHQRTWLNVTNDWRQKAESEDHALPPTPARHWAVPGAAREAAHHYAHVQWYKDAVKKKHGQPEPATSGARDWYSGLIGSAAADDGPQPEPRCLSDARGGVTATSLLRLCTLPAPSVVPLVVLRMGRKGLFVAPLQPRRALEVTWAVAAARGWQLDAAVRGAATTSYADRGRDAAINRVLGPALFPCVLCHDVQGEDVGHLFARCTHAALVPLRTAMTATVTKLLRDIVAASVSVPWRAPPAGVLEAAVAAAATVDWASADGSLLLTHLALAAPIPPTVDEDAHPVCGVVRSLFDAVPADDRRSLRRIADVWVQWAADWAWRFLRARCRAYRELEPASSTV